MVFCPGVRDFKIFRVAANFDEIKQTSNKALDLDDELTKLRERVGEDSSILNNKKWVLAYFKCLKKYLRSVSFCILLFFLVVVQVQVLGKQDWMVAS